MQKMTNDEILSDTIIRPNFVLSRIQHKNQMMWVVCEMYRGYRTIRLETFMLPQNGSRENWIFISSKQASLKLQNAMRFMLF